MRENLRYGAKEYSTELPKSGLVEHNPMEILSSQLEVAKSVLHETGISAQQISAIGITNQRETTIVWDKNTESLYILLLYGNAEELRNK